MRKFLKLLTIYAGIITVLVLIINFWYMALDHRDLNNTAKFDDVPHNIQICNLGSSHGLYGFNYEALSEQYTCFNFALNSQSLSYDARILEYYKDHLQNGSIVFVTISYPSFFGLPETLDEEFTDKNMRYYDFLPPAYIKDYDIKTALLTKFPSLYAYETLPLALIGHYVDADTSLAGWEAEIDHVGLPDNTSATLKRHLIYNKLDENGNRIRNQEEIDALYKIIEICKEIGATPVLVTHPYSLVYENNISIYFPDFFDDFYTILDEIIYNTGVDYYNYSRDERFFKDFTYFRDADHLNKAGATLFTEILANEVLPNIWK